MRATIEHRELASGMTGNHKDYYVDCRLEFSEEERAIIKQRDLYDITVTVPAATPAPTKSTLVVTDVMRKAGPFVMAGAFIWGLAGGGTLAGLLFFAGLAGFVFGWIRTRTEFKRVQAPDQTLSIKQLLSRPSFTVHAFDPAMAKGFEVDVREQLAALKNVLVGSAELAPTQTFEI